MVCLITQVRGKQNGTTPVPNQPDAQPFQSGQTNAVNTNKTNKAAKKAVVVARKVRIAEASGRREYPVAQSDPSMNTAGVEDIRGWSSPTANLQSRPVYVNRHGEVQRPQQRMQRPQPMRRPKPMDVSAALAERQAQERKRIVRSLPPVWAEIPVGSAMKPCVMGRTGLLLTQESVGWLNQPRRFDIIVPAKPVAVVAAAPVAAPVAETKPTYRKALGRHTKKRRVVSEADQIEIPRLDEKVASRAYLESKQWSDRYDAAWTEKKKAMAKVRMIRSAQEPTPDAFMSGPGLSFEAEHELLRRRHVAQETDTFIVLSKEAMKDPISPFKVRIDLGSLIAAAAREAQQEVSALERAARVRRELARAEAQVAAELKAEAQAIVDAELAREAEEAALLADAEDTALQMVVEMGWTERKFNTYMAEWKKARAISRVKARMAALAEAKKDSKPDLVEEARADRATYPSYAAFRASRISGSRDSKPVHKGQSKVVTKRDVGVVVDPNMVGKVAFDKAANRPYVSARSSRVLDHVEEQMEKRQVADLIGPKVVARRVR